MDAVIGLCVALLAIALLIRIFENRFIFFLPRYPEGFASPQSYGLRPEEVWIETEDGVRLNAWFLPGPTRPDAIGASPKVLLWFHGNAENIGMGLDQMKAFAGLGASILALDYRGYGKSEGSPNEAGVYRDADAAYRFLTDARRFQARNIFVYGHSLGGAVAIDLASRRECGGLIVESSFTSAKEMARRMFRIPFLEYAPRSRFDSLSKIARARCPVLVLHGTRDKVSPFSMGQRLYDAAPEPKTLYAIEGAGHNDLFEVAGELYLDRLRVFLGRSSISGDLDKSAAKDQAHEVR